MTRSLGARTRITAPPGRGGEGYSASFARLRRGPQYWPGGRPPDPRRKEAAKATRRASLAFAGARGIGPGGDPRTPAEARVTGRVRITEKATTGKGKVSPGKA